MKRSSSRNTTDGRPRDSKRTARAKRATIARRQQRAAKRAQQGRG